MPYVIEGDTDSNRISYPEFSQDLVKEFFAPLARGAEFTSEIISKKPEPYFVIAPAKDGIPEIFGRNLSVWTVKENVKKYAVVFRRYGARWTINRGATSLARCMGSTWSEHTI